MGNYKQTASVEAIAAELAIRTKLAAVVDYSGTDPIIKVGTIGAGSVGFLVKIMDQRAGVDAGFDALPGFGTVTQPVYTTGVAQVCFELACALNTEFVGTYDHLLSIIGSLVHRGIRTELYSVAATNAPDFAGTLTAQGAFEPNLYWPLQGRV